MKKTLVLFALSLGLLWCNPVITSADITTLYTLDEKEQVLFGDSVEIVASSTYFGLENYTHDYVDGYLHITFTYTHSSFAFAAYPPVLYVTSLDPTSTTTISVREQQPIYTLLTIPPSTGHETDWYLYDVQFDATGYHALVMEAGATTTADFHRDIAGISDTDWVALTNFSPIQDPVTHFSMAFAPLPVHEAAAPPTPSTTTTPVIIVPGIMASRLIVTDEVGPSEAWPNIASMILPGSDSYLDKLILDADGSGGNQIEADEIINSLGDNDFFNGLLTELSNQGFTENTDLFIFPYDWRLDIGSTAAALAAKIDEVRTLTGAEKVDLIAHSMGGLVVKEYLRQNGGDSIDKFIDIATPHEGAPKAFKILTFGDDLNASVLFDLIGLNSLKIKEISQNMPAVYDLLPSRSYFNSADSNYSYYVYNGLNTSNRLSFDETADYMRGDGRNDTLLSQADAFHNGVDSLSPASYGISTYNIVGCGVPTVGQFYILNHDGDNYDYNIRFINGDGTVPLRSAEALAADKTYYAKNIEHALMPSASGVKELVASILSDEAPDLLNITEDSSACSMPNGKVVSFHSPIDLDIYDSFGNHAGPDANGDIENNIAGVSYEVVGTDKFAYLPEGTDYSIIGKATGAGTFDTYVQEVVNGEVVTTTVFQDVPLSTSTQVSFNVGANIPSEINIDADNDGEFESSWDISKTYAGIVAENEPSDIEETEPEAVSEEESVENIAGSASPVVSNEEAVEPDSAALQKTYAEMYWQLVQIKNTLDQMALEEQSASDQEHTPAEEITSVPEYQGATVYASIAQPAKNAFKKLWLWFKSKL